MLRGINRDMHRYNQKVLEWLRKHSPAHADELKAHGGDRGWWDQINYFRVKYRSVEQCGKSIVEKPI
jgi:hypothetical protein